MESAKQKATKRLWQAASNARGWVYVISNEAMPGIVKVGYSLKDPEIRAAELNHTGSPHPYTVEYEALVVGPRNIERASHKILAQEIEGKEWFRCSAEKAAIAIKQAAAGSFISEDYKKASRLKAEKLFIEKKLEDDKARILKKTEENIEEALRLKENEIKSRHEKLVLERFPPAPFWNYWLVCSVAIWGLLAWATTNMPDLGVFVLGVLGGAFSALMVRGVHEDRQKSSPEYSALKKQSESGLLLVREFIVACSSCGQRIRFNRHQVMLYIETSSRPYTYRCQSCGNPGEISDAKDF